MLPLLLSLAAPAAPLGPADALAAGDCRAVLAQTGDDEKWRVPRGYCQLKLGDPAAAKDTLETPVDGVVGDYALLILARARLALGDPEGAEAALSGLELPGAAGDDVRRTRARLAVQRADRTAFDAITRGLDDPEIRFLSAELAHSEGRTEHAWDAWRALYRDAEPGGWDDQAHERLKQTGAPADEVDPFSRMVQLRKVGRIDEAAALADELSASSRDGLLALARVYKQARRYPEALKNYQQALGSPQTATGSASLMFDYALSTARTGDYATAAVIYRRLVAQHPTDKRADTSSYKLGYMAYDEGNCDRALELFRQHMTDFPASKHLDEALWFSGRCHWRASRYADAARDLGRIRQERPKSSLVSGAAYWKARALGEQGNREAEAEGLKAVLRGWPTSGYAWFAADRLGTKFEPRSAAQAPPWPTSLAQDEAVKRAEALLALGFRTWARAELQPVRSKATSREAALAAAWRFIAVGDYKTGQKLARPYCTSPWKQGDPVAQQACTPRPESSIVSEVAGRFDLNPSLPYAIMTAESALDPSVTSWAGARGLMQLMPAEGPRIHEQLYADRPYDPDDLYQAPYNASMGTAELGLKRQSLEGVLDGDDLPAIIASYNGGEAAVRRWVESTPGDPPLDAFTEDIGYTETRRYVKRVLGFLMTYRWVYGDPE